MKILLPARVDKESFLGRGTNGRQLGLALARFRYLLRVRRERVLGRLGILAAVALAGATAHELNQPLTSVMGIVELLMATDRSESEVDRLERAYEQLERMAEIVRDLSKVTQYKTTQYVEGVNILDFTGESQ